MALVRRNGQLVEEETLQERVKRLGVSPTAVVSPGGALQVGATPDQIKMAGTPAQKKPVLQQAVAPQQSLQRQQRIERFGGSTQQQQQAVGQQQQEAQQLQALGSLSSRVQSLVEKKLRTAGQQAATGQAFVDTDALASALGKTPEQLAQDPNAQAIQQKLQEFGANPTEEKLKELQQLGLDVVSVEDVQDKFLGGAAAAGRALGEELGAEEGVTLGQLNPQELGYQDFTEMAQAIGVTEADLQGMTVEDLQQRMQEIEQQRFDKIKTLQARLQALPPGSAARQIVERQLAQLQQAGAAGVEQQFAETAEGIDLADTVEIGGQEVSVEDVFADEQLSNIIEQYLGADETTREQLLPKDVYGDLRQFIEANELALADLTGQMETTQETFREAQEGLKQIGQVTENVSLDPETLKALGIDTDQVVTSTELEAMKQQLQSSPIGQLAQEGGEEAENILRDINPETIEQLKDAEGNLLPADQIKTAWQAGRQLQEDPKIAEWAGVDSKTKFVTDPAQQQAVATAAEVASKLGKDAALVNDPNFEALDLATKKALADNPQQIDDFKQYSQAQRTLQEIDPNDPVSATKAVLGASYKPEELQRAAADIAKWSRVNHPQAQRIKKELEALGVDPSKLGDPEYLQQFMQQQLSKVSPEDIAQGKATAGSFMTSIRKLQEAARDMASGIKAGPVYEAALSTKEPGDIMRRVFRVNNLGRTGGRAFFSTLVDNIKDIQRVTGKSPDVIAKEAANTMIRDIAGSIPGGGDWMLTPTQFVRGWTSGDIRRFEKLKDELSQRLQDTRDMAGLPRQARDALYAAWKRVSGALQSRKRYEEAVARDRERRRRGRLHGVLTEQPAEQPVLGRVALDMET